MTSSLEGGKSVGVGASEWVNEGFLVCGSFLIISGFFSVKGEAEQRWKMACCRIEERFSVGVCKMVV